jgi:transcriptional regulator with GAF, ATPase, and Fis domain
MASTNPTNQSSGKNRKVSSEPGTTERQTWRNWFMLGGVAAVTTMGLTASVSFLLWPWTTADIVPLTGLVLVVFVTVAYLTHEQRRALNMRRQMQKLQSSAIEFRCNRLYELLTVTRLLDSEADPESIFKSIPNVCLQIFNCEKASLMLSVEDGQYLEVQSAAGYSDRKIVGTKQKVGDGIAGWVARNQKPVVLQGRTDPSMYPGLNFKSRGVSAAIVVPIMLNEKFLGVINMSTRSLKVYYDDEDLRALEAFAENVAVCISHVFRTRRMKQTIAEQQEALQKMYTSTTKS